MVDEELISSNPVTSFKRRYLRKFKDENTSDARQIISVEQASLLVNSTLNSRDKAILILLFKTGMRRGELCNLDVDDIDFENLALRLKPQQKCPIAGYISTVKLNTSSGRGCNSEKIRTKRELLRYS